MEDKILIPNAPILVESTRSVGYSFESALADIIDNSIGNKAKNIDVVFDTLDEPYLAIIDDGCGMTEEELEIAMQYGSKSSLEEREKDDLGRFGLGLKMASLSQCRCLTVISKKGSELSVACWDLDHIIKTNKWSLIKYSQNEIKKMQFVDELNNSKSGTVVIWRNFDRIQKTTNNFKKTFDDKIDIARDHISLVFHRYLDGEDVGNNISISINGKPLIAIDPFLRNNASTQPLEEQSFKINNETIKVKPYILPYATKLKQKEKEQLGDLSSLRQTQGFYVYRNKRLIIWGTWFKLIKNYELNKLARVRVDIPNSLDSIWEIDIKKSTASLPDIIKKNLVSIVENTVGKSEKVYKYRGRKVSNDLQCLWNVIDDRGSFKYQVNRDTQLYKMLEDQLDENGMRYLNYFLSALEDSFPFSDVYYRMAKSESGQNIPTMEFDEVYRTGEEMILRAKDSGLDINTLLDSLDKIDFFAKYPEVIEKLKEDYQNE